MKKVMNNIKLFLIILAIASATITCRIIKNNSSEVELEGQFFIVESEPFTKLVFKSTNGNTYVVHAKEDKKFAGLQGKRVRIKGKSSTLKLKSKRINQEWEEHFLKEIQVLE